MRKSFFITAVTSAVFTTTLITGSASATDTYDGNQYWTFSEMVAFSEEVKPEWSSICAGGELDWNCERSIELHRWFNQSEKHRALRLFEGRNFTISSIDPSAGILKVHYDPNLSGSEMDDLYVVWFDGEPDYLYQTNIKNDQKTDNTHLLIKQLDSVDATILPLSTEVEFQMIDRLDPNADTYHQIYYNFKTHEHGRTSGMYDYSSCVDSPDYQEGTECKVAFSANKIFYLPAQSVVETPLAPTEPESTEPEPAEPESTEPEPAEPESTEPEPTEPEQPAERPIEPEPIPEPDASTPVRDVATAVVYSDEKPTGQSAQTPVAITIEPISVRTTQAQTQTLTQTAPTDLTSTEEPTTTNTITPTDFSEISVPTANGETRQIKDTPIWIISLVIFVCSGVILWFFLPRKRQKSKKIEKKS